MWHVFQSVQLLIVCDILLTEFCLIQIGNYHAWLFVHRWKMEWVIADCENQNDSRFQRLWSMIFHVVVWPKLLLITKTCKTYHWPLRTQDGQKISRWLCFSRLRILQAKRFRKVIPKGQQSEDSNTTTTGVTSFNNKKDTDEEVEESGNESDDTPSHADVGHDSDAEVSCPWVVGVNWSQVAEVGERVWGQRLENCNIL